MAGEVSKTIWQWLLDNIGKIGWLVIIVLFLLSCFFKVAKKEINPLGWILALIGKPLTKDVRDDIAKLTTNVNQQKTDFDQQITGLKGDIKTLKTDVTAVKTGTTQNCQELKDRLQEIEDAQQKSNDMQTIGTIRTHILDFANTCFNKRKHTKREFENIIEENAMYEKLVKKHDVKNDVYKEDYEYILKCYHKCQEEGSFLKEED